MATIGEKKPELQLIELAETSQPKLLSQARELLLEYGQFIASQPVAANFCFGALKEEAESLPSSYREKGGGCIVGLVRGDPAGFVAWRRAPGPHADDAWELKRLWVRPDGRGTGLGRALTQAVFDRAEEANRSAVYLDTAPEVMGTAHRLYLAMGFVPCAAYNGDPVEGLDYLVRRL